MDIETDGDVDEVEDEVEEHEEKDNEEEELEEEDEDEDEDDGKESQMIGQGEMVNTSATHADTMVDEEPTVLAEQVQEIG